MKDTVFLCVGGDARQIYAGRKLSEIGKVYAYKTCGGVEGAVNLNSMEDMRAKADLLVLPMLTDGKTVCGQDGEAIDYGELVPCIKPKGIVTGGRLGVELIEYFSALGFEVADYFNREELVIKNCIPTAEGTLEIAMREMGRTIFGSRVLIIGFGRVAKATARLFSAVGAEVVCTARSLSAIAQAETSGYGAFPLGELYGRIGGYSLIINTVPATVLDGLTLTAVSKDAVIIDLASKPGGVDFEQATRLNRRTVHALSLPGKSAPITAGEIIAEAVVNIMRERGERNVA